MISKKVLQPDLTEVEVIPLMGYTDTFQDSGYATVACTKQTNITAAGKPFDNDISRP
jgi:hypothetical protein